MELLKLYPSSLKLVDWILPPHRYLNKVDYHYFDIYLNYKWSDEI